MNLQQRIESLGEWFHNIDLDDIQTAPAHPLGDYPNVKWKHLAHAIPSSLAGKSVLDIGCNAGFYSIQMKKRGAARVLGIDSDDRYLAQARLAAEVTGADIELRNMDVYSVAQLKEKFDIVIFMGVLYHLRHPLLALDLLAEHVVQDTLIFQSMLRGSNDRLTVEADYPFSETAVFNKSGYPIMHFVEHRYAHDHTNWWIPNRACAEAMLRSAGFAIQSRPEEEIYICKLRGAE